MDTKAPKKRQKGDSNATALKHAQIIAKAIEGKQVNEIAAEMGMARRSVSQILNSDDVKEKVKEIEGKLACSIDDAINTIQIAINSHHDMGNALKAAIALLKNFGGLKESVEHKHTFPQRTVIHKLDGSKVILGTTGDDDEDESE